MKPLARCVVLVHSLVCALLWVSPADAHPAPFSFLDVRLRPETIDVSLTVHIFDLAHDLGIEPMTRLLDSQFVTQEAGTIQALLTPRFALSADSVAIKPEWLEFEVIERRQAIRWHLRYPLTAAPAKVTIDALMFPYDTVHQTFINVFEADQLTWQALLGRDFTRTDYVVGTRQTTMDVILKFVPSGVHHILIGPDHILFLVGLLLLGGSFRQLLLVVTAFTFAHSITLSLAALEILTPPAEVVEPAIALSIVYVGAENILKQGGRDTRVWVALIFGFIHGFGFANVLRDMGLPGSALAASLFSFNVGVEIGQLLVVAIVASAITALRSRSERAGRQLAFVGSIIVLMAGAYWFFERVFFTGVRLT